MQLETIVKSVAVVALGLVCAVSLVGCFAAVINIGWELLTYAFVLDPISLGRSLALLGGSTIFAILTAACISVIDVDSL